MKISKFFLLILFATAYTPLQELTKIPSLLHHFSEHKSKNQTTSLTDFIIDHYGNPENLPEHKNLPMKSMNMSIYQLYSFHDPIKILFKETILILFYPKSDNDKPCSGIIEGIFQPPRIA